MSKFKTLIVLLVVVLGGLYISTNNVKAINEQFEYNTEYTLNEYFGNGDYEYFNEYLNTYLSETDKTTYSPAQLATINQLKFESIAIVDFPKDLSIFTSLKSIQLIEISQLTTVGFKYHNDNSNLQSISFSYLPNLTHIDNLDIQYKDVFSSSFTIYSTPLLETFTNNSIVNANSLDMVIGNVSDEIYTLIREDERHYNNLNQDSILENNVIKRKSISDFKALPSYNVTLFENNNLNNFDSIQITHSIISGIDINNSDISFSLYIYNSLIDKISVTSSSNSSMNSYSNIYLNGSYINELDVSKMSKYNGVTLNLVNNSIEKVSNIELSNIAEFSYYISGSYIKELGDIAFNNNNVLDNASLYLQFNGSTFNKIGKVTADTTNADYINFNFMLDNSFVDIIDKSSINLSTSKIDQGSNITYSFNFSTINNVKGFDVSDNTTNGYSSYNMYGTTIKELGPINSYSSANVLYFQDTIIDEMKDIYMLGTRAEFYVMGDTGVTKYGNIKLELIEQEEEYYPMINLRISQDSPITSIGNIFIDSKNDNNDNAFVLSTYNDESNKIDNIGDLTLKGVKNLEIINMGVKSIGLIDAPVVDYLDLSGNQLVKLDVKNDVFPDSLVNYNFNGNQIVGDLPIREDIRNVDYYLNNYFNINQSEVSKQNSLVMEYLGNTYYSQDLDSLNSVVLPEITIEEGTALNLTPFTDNISLYNESNPVSLFKNHTFGYEVYNTSLKRVNDLVLGENIVAITLGNATPGKTENTNAKIFIKIIVTKKPVSPPINEKPTTPPTNNPVVNVKVDNLPTTGSTLPIGIIIISALVGFTGIVCFNRYKIIK